MKKIMFNDKYGLTQAVLEGRKTQTRRIVPKKILDMVEQYQDEYYAGALDSISIEDAIYNITHGEKMAKAPYYVGEEVAIAQSYFDCGYSIRPRSIANPIQYSDGSAGWNNKMFVRADLMPHRIKITNVRVERLQDISDEDCLKEGIIQRYNYCLRKNIFGLLDGNKKVKLTVSWKVDVGFDTPREAFAALIDKTCGRGTWDSNPWVFVYDFELVR